MSKPNINLNYKEQGGMLLPDLQISNSSEADRPLGRYGRMALEYLKDNQPERYTILKMDGSLMEVMHRVQDEAMEKIEALTQQMLQQEPMPQTEGYSGADSPPERPEADGGGNGTPDHRADPPLTEEQPHIEAPQGAEHEGEPPAQDGSFLLPRRLNITFSDEEVRRHYEHILTSTDLYPPLNSIRRCGRCWRTALQTTTGQKKAGRSAVCSRPMATGSFRARYCTAQSSRGEDGISFYFDDGYTYFPWPSLANLLDALIETGVYPDVAAEEEPDPIGDYNIPDEIEEMGGVPQREIGQADYDYVLGAVAYEAGETAEEPVRPQAVFTEIKGIPKADEIDSFVRSRLLAGNRSSWREIKTSDSTSGRISIPA